MSIEPKTYINPYRQFEGVFTPIWLLERTEISQGAKHCYGMLAKRAYGRGEAEPPKDELATALGVDVRTITTYIEELKESELIEVVRRGLGRPNAYRFYAHPWMEGAFVPDRKKASDPDRKKASDQDRKSSSDQDGQKASAQDGNKTSDPDRKKASDSIGRKLPIQSEENLNPNRGEGEGTPAPAFQLLPPANSDSDCPGQDFLPKLWPSEDQWLRNWLKTQNLIALPDLIVNDVTWWEVIGHALNGRLDEEFLNQEFGHMAVKSHTGQIKIPSDPEDLRNFVGEWLLRRARWDETEGPRGRA